jgi:hypothetical protein
MDPESQMQFHFRSVIPLPLREGEYLEIRYWPRSATRKSASQMFLADVDLAVERCMRLRESCEVFFGVATRRCPDGTPMPKCVHRPRGGKDHIGRFGAAWVDLDLRVDTPDASAILAKLTHLPVPADLTLLSGHGIHAYWLYQSPVSDLLQAEYINRCIGYQLGADNCWNGDRILRPAGTLNHKRGGVAVTLLQ